MKNRPLREIKPNLIPIPIPSKEQAEKEYHKLEEQLLKDIAKMYRISVKDIIRRTR